MAGCAVLIVNFQNCAPGFAPLSLSASSVNGLLSAPLATDAASLSVENVCGANYGAGFVPIHRLTNAEYNHTVHDLLATSLTPADAFPPDLVAPNGFTNESSQLKIFDDLMVHYYDAAVLLAGELVANKSNPGSAYQSWLGCGGTTATARVACAQKFVRGFGAKAYRRPLTEGGVTAEYDSLMQVYAGAADFDSAIKDVVTAVLISPKFLFLNFAGPVANTGFNLNPYQLASRLSYFIWESLPDDELFALAANGTLGDPTVLRAQMKRMLSDSKSQRLVRTLRDEWLGLGTLATSPVAGLDDSLRLAMVQESGLFLQDLVDRDASLISVVSANYSFVNQALALLYGLKISTADANQFVRADLSATPRMGVLTQASLLTATSGEPTNTHPVKRGKWVTRQIMCDEPPPPPPGIPVVTPGSTDGQSIRQKLEAHTSNPACTSCHVTMDAVGFALENFDPLGRYRTTYAGTTVAVDAHGTLYGTTFSDAKGLVGALATAPAVRTCLPLKWMNFALARTASGADDLCVAGVIGKMNLTATSKLSDLVGQIVLSHQFRAQAQETP